MGRGPRTNARDNVNGSHRPSRDTLSTVMDSVNLRPDYHASSAGNPLLRNAPYAIPCGRRALSATRPQAKPSPRGLASHRTMPRLLIRSPATPPYNGRPLWDASPLGDPAPGNTIAQRADLPQDHAQAPNPLARNAPLQRPSLVGGEPSRRPNGGRPSPRGWPPTGASPECAI